MNNYPLVQNSITVLNKIIILYIISNLICPGFCGAKIISASAEESDYFSPYNLVFEGDSLTAGEIYPQYVERMLSLDANRDVSHNVATGGETLYPTMVMDAPHQVDAKILGANYQNIAILWAGTNDIYLDSTLDASILHESIRDWCIGRKEAGFQVILCTITPRSDYGTPRSFEKNRQALNEMIRGHYIEYADGLADIAADPQIGNAGDELDTIYYNDRVHMTPLGYAIVANIVKNSINSLPGSEFKNDLN